MTTPVIPNALDLYNLTMEVRHTNTVKERLRDCLEWVRNGAALGELECVISITHTREVLVDVVAKLEDMGFKVSLHEGKPSPMSFRDIALCDSRLTMDWSEAPKGSKAADYKKTADSYQEDHEARLRELNEEILPPLIEEIRKCAAEGRFKYVSPKTRFRKDVVDFLRLNGFYTEYGYNSVSWDRPYHSMKTFVPGRFAGMSGYE